MNFGNVTLILDGPIYVNSNEILHDFYEPLIGEKACLLYSLFEDLSYKKIDLSNKIFEDNKITSSDYLFSRRSLEAVGLISTFKNSKENLIIFVHGVSLPNDFLKNPILFNLLLNSKNKDFIDLLKNKYEIKISLNDYQEVSASINDCFNIESLSSSSSNDSKRFITKNKNDLKINFDLNKFRRFIDGNSQFGYKGLSEEEILKIKQYASLFDFDEKQIGQITIDSYDFSKEVGNRINFDYFKDRIYKTITFNKAYKAKNKASNTKIINSETELANRINNYEMTSPRTFLKDKQNGIEPVVADLRLLDYLNINLNLSVGVINCLIDYCLIKQNGDLNRSYVEKIAASLVRKHIDSALDCYYVLFSKRINNNSNSLEKKAQSANKEIENNEIKKEFVFNDDDDDESIFED